MSKTPVNQLSSSSLLAAVLNSTTDAIITFSANGHVTGWYGKATTVFGFSSAEVFGQPVSKLFYTTRDLMFEKFASEPSLLSLDYRTFWRTKHQGFRHLSVNLSRVADDQGGVPGIIAILNPVVEKVDDSGLNRQQTELQTLFDNTEEGFMLLDTQGIIRAVNGPVRDSGILHFPQKTVVEGTSIFQYIDPGRVDTFRSMVQQVLAGHSVSFDRPHKTATGKDIWYHISLSPVRETGNISGVCIVGHNITRRKLAEEAAEINERRFRGIVESSEDAIAVLTIDGKPLYVSPSVERLLGYSEKEAMQLDLFSLIHPDDVSEVVKVWEKVLEEPGKPIRGYPCRVMHKDGNWRWLDDTITDMRHDPAIGGIVENFRDITAVVEANAKLKESEERYKYLFYSNPLPMWIYEESSLRFLEVNNVAISKYGYTHDEFLSMTILDIRPRNEWDRVKFMASERVKPYTKSGAWTHITKDGTALSIEVTSHRIKYEDKDAVLVLANDITEKEQALALVYKSHQQNIKILESINDGFFTVDRNWTVTYWNKEAERMMQMPRKDILGKNLWEVYSSVRPLKFYSEAIYAMENQVPVSYEEYFPPLDVWFDVSVYPSEEGLSLYFKDINERKQSECRIVQANERYEMVARATNDAIYEWDVRADVNYWGEGYRTLFGHDRIDGPMPGTSWSANLHPDDREMAFQSTLDAFAAKNANIIREFRFRCADGTFKTVLDKVVITYDENGEPLKITGAMQDITDRKANECAIRQLNDALNGRAEELARSNEELERFAYVSSHDLQEPLRMVSSFLQLLEKKYKNNLDDTAQRYIRFAVEGADRMKRLILDLLEYSRVGTNKDEMVQLDMRQVIELILHNFSVRIHETAAQVQVDPLPSIVGNRMQIGQLFQNLVSNAFKYNKSATPKLHIGCNDIGAHWEFFVRDNGIGIEQRFFDKIFVIFQRLHNKDEFSGTGIGLAICKKIAERHGGQIRVESTPGEGTTFFITMKKSDS